MAIVLIFSGVRKSRSLLTKTDEDALELLLNYLQKIPSCVLLKELAGLIETGEVYNVVTLKKITEENQAAVELLRKLVEAQGMFLV